MSTNAAVSAISHPEGWHAIQWRHHHRQVRKLQVRIAKATSGKQWRRVKSLQRMLVHSFSAKALAVKRVTENPGRRTPGIDRQTWSTPESKWKAIFQLSRTGYKPLPLRRIYIPKSNGKSRPLGIPAMRDRAMQALWLLALDPVAESTSDRNSYGFRPLRSTADATGQIFICLGNRNTAEWVLEGDIKGCFDNISHDWLLENIPMDRQILRKWLKAGFMDKGIIYATDSGTPQGSPISPVLSNMCLDGLEQKLAEQFGQKNTAPARRHKVNYVRFADDFICTGSSRELLEEKVKPIIIQFMAERGLTLSEEKTIITHIDNGFDFLGRHIRKYNGKLLIKPSKKNLKNHLDKVRTIIEKNQTVTAAQLIIMLNPVIRGWANYHRNIVAKRAFNYVDNQIWRKIWQWCKRRHQNKGSGWVYRKYFRYTRTGTYRWLFCGKDRNGKIWELMLSSSVPISRHIKIKTEANFYNPRWETYFEQRQDKNWAESQKGKRKITAIWHRQNHICPVCGQRFTKETGWHIHHKVMKILGGGDEPDNLMLLHPNCHRQIHSNETGSREREFIKA